MKYSWQNNSMMMCCMCSWKRACSLSLPVNASISVRMV